MSLADFYGLPPASEREETADDGHHQQQQAAADEKKRSARTALDSESFDAQAYLHTLLGRKSMRDLIQHDNAMIAEKRALDSDMQTLVYDNYNKFISATDMIRSMKTNVESMEAQMASLLTNMNDISQSCAGLEATLTPNRTKVENLLGVSRLLKRLEFLFELPGKLKKAIELGAYEQAVRYFRISSSILDQYAHHKSFEHIRRESAQIIGELKLKLRALIADPNVSHEQRMSYTAMLVLDLAEPDAPQLVATLVDQHRKRFEAGIAKAVELANKAQQQQNAAVTRRSSLSKDPKSTADLDAASLTSPTFASTSNLLTLLQQHFLTPYVLFTDTFLSTLVRPYEAKVKKLEVQRAQLLYDEQQRASEQKSASTPTGAASPISTAEAAATSLAHLTQALTLCRDALIHLSVDLFDAYFTHARRELLKRASIATSSANGASQDASQLVLQFTSTLKSFYDGLEKPFLLLPKAKLGDRAQELVHHAITHCVESICEYVHTQCVQILAQAHSQVLAWRPGSTAPLAQTPSAASAALRKSLEDGFSLLVVVLSTREYLPEAVAQGFSFAELARAHASELLHRVTREIAYRTPKRAELVYDVSTASSALTKAIEERLAASTTSTGVRSDRDARTPLFYLFLAQVASAQESKDITGALKTLAKFFPPTAPPTRRGGAAQGDHLAADLLARSKESIQGLLLRYCETHGFGVTEIVRANLIAHDATDEPRHPSELVDKLQLHLHRVASELALLFPRSSGFSDHNSSSRDLLGGGRSGVASTPGHRSGASSVGIHRDIQRLFTQKVITYAGIDADGVITELQMNRTQPMWAICKIIFKAMMERVRMERLTSGPLHQFQLDVFTLRHELPTFLPEASADTCKVLYLLLDEALNAASERSTASTTLLDEYTIADAYDASRAQRPPVQLPSEETTSSNADSDAATDGSAASFYSTAAGTASASAATAPTGALARLVLSPSNTTQPAKAEHISPTTIVNQAHSRQSSGAFSGVQP